MLTQFCADMLTDRQTDKPADIHVIKTHGSESRGQQEAAVCGERVSYLHVALL